MGVLQIVDVVLDGGCGVFYGWATGFALVSGHATIFCKIHYTNNEINNEIQLYILLSLIL